MFQQFLAGLCFSYKFYYFQKLIVKMALLFIHCLPIVFLVFQVNAEYPVGFIYEQLMDSILDFSMSGFNLLSQNSPQGNVLYSAFSVYNILMIAHLGARGKTAQQICHTLGICHFNKTTVRHFMIFITNLSSFIITPLYTFIF